VVRFGRRFLSRAPRGFFSIVKSGATGRDTGSPLQCAASASAPAGESGHFMKPSTGRVWSLFLLIVLMITLCSAALYWGAAMLKPRDGNRSSAAGSAAAGSSLPD